MVNVVKGIDIVSHHDGKRYTNRIQYERALEREGCYVKPPQECNRLIEKLNDMKHSKPQAPQQAHNHTHIDLRNMRVETSYNPDNNPRKE